MISSKMSTRFKISDYLNRDEIRDLTQPSDLRGFQALITSWGMIAASMTLVAIHPAFWSVILATVIIGGRQLALAILMHDSAHYSLFKTRSLNQWIGSWLCAYPTGHDLTPYREHHIRHHKFAGSSKDPDLDLSEGFPIPPASFLRKFTRDLVGITGIKRLYGVFLMDCEYIEFTVSAKVTPIDYSKGQKQRTRLQVIQTGIKNSSGKILTNIILFGILALVGKPWLYGLWVLAYLTTFSLFVRVRSLAEHACTEQDLDPLKNTRTTYASPLARVTVAPHRVNYHLEHHLLMTAPNFKLPVLNRLLKDRGALTHAYLAKNYTEVLRIASTVKESDVA